MVWGKSWSLDNIINSNTIGVTEVRKVLPLAVFLLFTIVLLCSCSIHSLLPFPYGKWQNAELGLIMDLNPEFEDKYGFPVFPGTYVEDGVKIDVYIHFFTPGITADILRASDRRSGGWFGGSPPLYGGHYKVSDNQLYLSLNQQSQERAGLETIVFDRIEDYG